jgi:Tfp pilus assembly protein PilZ
MDSSSSTFDRRAYIRKSCLLPVDYLIGGRMHRDFVRDISAGGLLIETGGKFLAGQEVSLTFMDPGFGKQTKVMAQIAWIGPQRIGLRFNTNDKEVTRVGKVKRKRLAWDRSLSDKVTRYRVYWSKDGGIDYGSQHVEVGNVVQVTLPDDIPSFPLVAGEIELGVSAISEAGNESEITKFRVSIDFIAPEPPKNLRLEDLQDNPK